MAPSGLQAHWTFGTNCVILVDTLARYERRPHGHYRWCHMTSDTSLEELHAFARKIGRDLRWFEDKSTPHYDLTDEFRQIAVRHGAQEVTRSELVRRGLKRRNPRGEDL